MKRLWAFLMALVFLTTFVSCGESKDKPRLRKLGDTVADGKKNGKNITANSEKVIFGDYIKDTDMAGYWKFDGVKDGVAADDSGNGNNAPLTGAGTLAEGFKGKGLQVKENETVTIKEASPLSGFDTMTLNFWLKLDDIPPRDMMILGKDSVSPFEYRVVVHGNGGAGHAVIHSKDAGWYDGNKVDFWQNEKFSELPGRWVMLTVVYDGKYIYTYSDGRLNNVSVSLSGPVVKTNAPLYIGNNVKDKVVGFNGMIDELLILKKSLSREEVGRMYADYTGTKYQIEEAAASTGKGGRNSPDPGDYQLAAYYFPQWHPNELNDTHYGKGWTEWEYIKNAKPRFNRHEQPKIPLWGYEDESDPKVMEKKIKTASNYGLDAFIFDWYWNDAGPYLNGCLDKGFLKAGNAGKLKFSLMWANHDLFTGPGTITTETFRKATDYIIKNYFTHPSYWKVDGKLYFSIYEMHTLVKSFGSVAKTADALADFRKRARKAGVGEIHLNAVAWGVQIPECARGEIKDAQEYLTKLGVDSVTSYVWIHHTAATSFPSEPYSQYRVKALKGEERLNMMYSWLPYFPNASMGWDPSPRANPQEAPYENKGYPFTTVLTGNTPVEFKKSLEELKKLIDTGEFKRKIVTINSWNEWGEGSYIEPDSKNRMGYLEAIRDVFGK